MFKNLFTKLVDGFIYGLGFMLFSSMFAGVILFFTGQLSFYQIQSTLQNQGVLAKPLPQKADKIATTVDKIFMEPALPIPSSYIQLIVNNSRELLKAIQKAHQQGGSVAIILESGEYLIPKTLYIKVPNIMIRSQLGNPYDVVLKGSGAGNLFRVSADYFSVDGITLSNSRNHLIQVAGESRASYFTINNSILEDGYEQFIKVSYSTNTPENKSIEGLVENSIFQFTKGIASNYYTGGIDAIGAVDWVVKNNVFRDIASPASNIAQHGVHFWVNSSGNQIINNLFIDNDRAIGFGMPLGHNESVLEYSHKGGIIEGNLIFHSNNHDPFADTGIVLEAAEGALVKNNIIYMEHDYPRAIEYRFASTKNVIIKGNQVNKRISSRNGGSAQLIDNSTNLAQIDFLEDLKQMENKLGIQDLYKPLSK